MERLHAVRGYEWLVAFMTPYVKPGKPIKVRHVKRRKAFMAALWNAYNGNSYKPHKWTAK